MWPVASLPPLSSVSSRSNVANRIAPVRIAPGSTSILGLTGNVAWRTDIMNEALFQAWGIARRWHAAHPIDAR